MTDLGVSERRIRPIQEAAANRNWKQALQLCEKWQKKGEKSDRFLALKASVLVNQQDKAQVAKGKAETLQLCRRATPVTDIEALYQLQGSLKQLSLHNEEGPKLWDRAVSEVPTDKGLLMTWLDGSIADANWLMAQKAAMALRKAFPKERKYEFWNVLFCHLVQNDQSLSERDRTLFGTLAYRLISKAADTVPDDKTQIMAPGKAIATVEELALLTKIYRTTNRADEAIELLQNEKLGLKSKLAEQDPAMIFSLLLSCLHISSSVDLVLGAVQLLLDNDPHKANNFAEDDRLWKSLVRIDNKSTESHWDQRMSLVETTLKQQPGCRAAHLAQLDLLRNKIVGRGDVEPIMPALEEYYQQFRTKPFCFEDLIPHLQFLTAQQIRDFLKQQTPDSPTDIDRLFALRLEYNLSQQPDIAMGEILAFVVKALELCKSLPMDRNDRPEAALLASLALSRSGLTVQQPELALQASFILDHTYSQFPEFFPLAVRSVQLYRALGHMSLATERFMSLSIKNMQWETVGHLLLTRISTLHPLQSGFGEFSLNPLNALDTALDMLDHMEGSLNKAIQKGLQFGSYSNVLDSVDLKHDVHQSLNRQVFLIDERKIQRLAGVPIDTVLEPRPAEVIDKRDFSFLNKYGVRDGVLEDSLGCGPLPAEEWLDSMAFLDHLTTYLNSELASHTILATAALEATSKAFEKAEGLQAQASNKLTVAEKSCLDCHILVGSLVIALATSTPKQNEVDNSIHEIIQWLTSCKPPAPATINGIEVPTWQYIHCSFAYLETIQVLLLLANVLSRRAKTADKSRNITVTKEKIAEMQKLATEAWSAIHAAAQRVRDGVNAPGVLGKLIDAVAGRMQEGQLASIPEYRRLSEVCAELYDEITVEEYCGKLKESWDNVLAGILVVNIISPK